MSWIRRVLCRACVALVMLLDCPGPAAAADPVPPTLDPMLRIGSSIVTRAEWERVVRNHIPSWSSGEPLDSLLKTATQLALEELHLSRAVDAVLAETDSVPPPVTRYFQDREQARLRGETWYPPYGDPGPVHAWLERNLPRPEAIPASSSPLVDEHLRVHRLTLSARSLRLAGLHEAPVLNAAQLRADSAAVRAWYERHRDRFVSGPRLVLRRVLFTAPPPGSLPESRLRTAFERRKARGQIADSTTFVMGCCGTTWDVLIEISDSLEQVALREVAILRRGDARSMALERALTSRVDTIEVREGRASWRSRSGWDIAEHALLAADGEWLPAAYARGADLCIAQRIQRLPARPLPFAEAADWAEADLRRSAREQALSATLQLQVAKLDSLLAAGAPFDSLAALVPAESEYFPIPNCETQSAALWLDVPRATFRAAGEGAILPRLRWRRFAGAISWVRIERVAPPSPQVPEDPIETRLRAFDRWVELRLERLRVEVVDPALRKALRTAGVQPSLSLSPTSSSRTVPPRSRAAR